MGEVFFKGSVVKIGANAKDFKEENMLIFFREDAPAYLADFCYLIRPEEGNYSFSVGNRLVLDDVEYPITAIGDVAITNFKALGHLTVNFDGASEAAQPGTMHVKGEYPVISENTRVSIVS